LRANGHGHMLPRVSDMNDRDAARSHDSWNTSMQCRHGHFLNEIITTSGTPDRLATISPFSRSLQGANVIISIIPHWTWTRRGRKSKRIWLDQSQGPSLRFSLAIVAGIYISAFLSIFFTFTTLRPIFSLTISPGGVPFNTVYIQLNIHARSDHLFCVFMFVYP